MKRKRFNRLAICSSDDYKASKHSHLALLNEAHSHFAGIAVSGSISFDTPIFKNGKMTPKYKTIRVFGQEMQLTVEEYNTHCVPVNYEG